MQEGCSLRALLSGVGVFNKTKHHFVKHFLKVECVDFCTSLYNV